MIDTVAYVWALYTCLVEPDVAALTLSVMVVAFISFRPRRTK